MLTALLLALFAPPYVAPLLPLQRLPALGECLGKVPPTSVYTMAASAQTWASYKVIDGGISYTIGVDREERVRFVSTSDAAFASPEGLHIGDAAAVAEKAAPGQSIRSELGWGHFIRLPSGWYAFIDSSWIDTNGYKQPNLNIGKLGADARITTFFMRD